MIDLETVHPIDDAKGLIRESAIAAGAVIIGISLAVLYKNARDKLYFKKVFGANSGLVLEIDQELLDATGSLDNAGVTRTVIKLRNKYLNMLSDGVGYIRSDDLSLSKNIRDDTLKYFNDVRKMLKVANAEPPSLKVEIIQLRDEFEKMDA